MKRSGEKELLAFLRAIDSMLDGEGLKSKITLYLFGGAAAVIAYGSRRSTVDIDAFVSDAGIEAKLVHWAGAGTELARERGVYLQSANTTLMLIEEPDWQERSVEVLKGGLKHIRVRALGKEDLILSKLGRYNDRDREDIQFLIEHHQVDPKRLITFFKSARQYYVGRLEELDLTFNIVLEEHFGHPPLEFGGEH